MISSKSCAWLVFLSVVLLGTGTIFVPHESDAAQLYEPQEFSTAITKTSSHTAVESDDGDSAHEQATQAQPTQPTQSQSTPVQETQSTQNQPVRNGITDEGIFFEKTSIIEFTNNSDVAIESFTFWLGSGRSFESFKTESGWTGKKTPEGTIIFTATERLDTGESVKFGVKTSEPNPGLNWNAVDGNGNQAGIGKTTSEAIKDPEPDPVFGTPANGILEDSMFRIIPEKPNVGSTIRVVGESFGASQQLSFYIDTKKIRTFLSDGNGNFITTVKIPSEEEAERVNLKVIDANGNEKRISLRLGSIDSRVPEKDDIKLTISGLPPTLHRGDFLEISGTAQPGSAVTASVKDSEGIIINSRTAEADSKGDWKLPEPIVVPLDAEFGKYSIEISDGKDSILRNWEIESSKVIIIEPSKLKFEPGDVLMYSGTAVPNRPIEFVLEDPLGNEIFSDIVNTDNSGSVQFEYATSFSSKEGTYMLIATQDGNKEFVFAGLGQLPIIPIDLEFDKLNYKSNETAAISLIGEASDAVKLSIIDPSDQLEEVGTITLGPDGVGKHSLDLSGYKSGIYTAVISKGSSESTEIFTVGLRISIGEVDIETTNLDYHPGDSILILGNTDPNSLLTITLRDPDGNEVRVKDTFSDKDGRISDNTFKVPSDAESGHWTINAASGSHFDIEEINVTTTEQGMVVSVKETEVLGTEEYVIIEVIGAAPSQTAIIEIVSPAGDIIEKLEFPATSEGEISMHWPTSKIPFPETYTIKVKDAFQNAETTYYFG